MSNCNLHAPTNTTPLHEAGHAAVAFALSVTINRAHAAGDVGYVDVSISPDDPWRLAVLAFSGHAAERDAGIRCRMSRDDRGLLRVAVCIHQWITGEMANQFLHRAWNEAIAIAREWREPIRRLTSALATEKTLSGVEVCAWLTRTGGVA